MNGGPQIKDVAAGSAGRMEALENLFVQVDGKGAVVGFAVAMNRARSTALRSRTLEPRQPAQVFQDLRHAELAAQCGIIDTTSKRRGGWNRCWRVTVLVRQALSPYAGVNRG